MLRNVFNVLCCVVLAFAFVLGFICSVSQWAFHDGSVMGRKFCRWLLTEEESNEKHTSKKR